MTEKERKEERKKERKRERKKERKKEKEINFQKIYSMDSFNCYSVNIHSCKYTLVWVFMGRSHSYCQLGSVAILLS